MEKLEKKLSVKINTDFFYWNVRVNEKNVEKIKSTFSCYTETQTIITNTQREIKLYKKLVRTPLVENWEQFQHGQPMRKLWAMNRVFISQWS